MILTLFTSHHKDALLTFAAQFDVLRADSASVRIQYADTGAFAEALMIFLENIAVLENPVYRQSPKMQLLAKTLRNTSHHVEGTRALRRYLRRSRRLHVEGYVTFRMSAFATQLDLISYGLVKKLRLMDT